MFKTIFTASLLLPTIIHAAPIEARNDPASKSGKRGIAFDWANYKVVDMFNQYKDQVSWCYNWGSSTKSSGIEYVPLLHDNKPDTLAHWFTDIEKAVEAGSTYVMSINEPDECGWGGACITDVGTAIDVHVNYVEEAKKRHPGIKITAPSVTNGGEPTKGYAYLTQFINQCGNRCHFDVLIAHWYASAQNNQYYDWFTKFTGDLWAIHQLKPEVPIWLTEFGVAENERGTPIETAFLEKVIPWLDDQDWIERYAFHYAKPGVLINPEDTALSPLGVKYATIG